TIWFQSLKEVEIPGRIDYGAARSFFEIFRDNPRSFLGPFCESQVVSAILITYAVISIFRSRTNPTR
ncbi:MAG TPA: hypothetical protein DD658_05400, partial [Deltaproteobacteria bacterium]|nr:hypothetical protein [Deltaproteobacteria bacterium]